MAEMKDKIVVSVECLMHHTLQKLAEKVLREYGIKINYVSIEWRDSISTSDVISVSVNAETHGIAKS